MKKLAVFLCATTLLFGAIGVANALRIDFTEFGKATSRTVTKLGGDEWSSYGITMQKTFWYAHPKDPFDYHGIASSSNPGYISFSDPTDSVAIDWIAAASDDITIKAYNADLELVDTFYCEDSGVFSGTATLAGSSIAYLEFYGAAGPVGISTLEWNGIPVPEPATIVLVVTGLAGLAVFGRKKFKK